MTLAHIAAIIKKEGTIEFRRKHALFGILLFAVVLVYLIYKSFNRIEGLQWDVLLWIVVLFSGINAIAKSFSQESEASRMYYYTLFDAQEVIIAKTIYNFVFLAVIFILILGGFSFFIENPVKNFTLFFEGAILGILGLSVLFTFISSVSGQSGANNSMLMSIMSIPLTIPIVLLLIKITAVAMRLIQDSSVDKDLIMLGGIDLLLMGCMFILFGELWKD
jgi:heme exporter protein B